MTETLRIPYPKSKAGQKEWAGKYGLNAIYAGKHWSKRRQDSDDWHRLVRAEVARQGLRKTPIGRPVAISFYWNDRLDLDNHAYMAKMIVDALKGIWLEDDDRRHVREISHHWHDENSIKIEVSER